MKSFVTCLALFSSAFFLNAAHAYLSVSPPSLSFFNVVVGGSGASRSVNVRNSGRERVRVQVSGTCYGEFSLINLCGLELSPGGSCGLTVRFQPRRAGHHSCSLRISDTSGSSQTVSVTGNAVDR